MAKICGICCDSYNLKSKKCIKCQYCPFQACGVCVQTYLLQDEVQDPKCMNKECKRPWIPEFLSEVMPKTFMATKYKQHRERMLYQAELSFMPATQLVVEKDIQREKIDLKIEECRSLSTEYFNEYTLLLAESLDKTERKEYRAKKKALEDLRKECETRVSELYRERALLWDSGHSKVQTGEKKEFVKACPSNTCNGLLGSDWKCGICEVHVCKHCHETLGKEKHECDPEAVETVKLLAKNTKPCPKCSTAIFKIDGCDMMFCTQCHTAFSWNNMTIVPKSARIHNPHYYEYLRKNAANGEIRREPGDDGCAIEGLIRIDWFMKKVYQSNDFSLLDMHRFILHLQDHELRRTYPFTQLMDVENNLDLRKKYIRGMITREKFQVDLQRKDKKRQKTNEYHQVLLTFVEVATENINKFYRSPSKTILKDRVELNQTMEALRENINKSLEAIGTRYNNVYPVIVPWKLMRSSNATQ
jgi:hypothetical protein